MVTCDYWQGYLWLFTGEDLKFGHMFGSCIKTVPLLRTCPLPPPPPKMLMRWEYPDLALCYFWLFLELKMAGEATEFQTLSAFQDMH